MPQWSADVRERCDAVNDIMHTIFAAPMEFPFMRTALAAGLLAGASCALLGVHVVHRRMAFVGDAMAHTALPGLVVAQWLGISLFIGAIAANCVTALLITVISGSVLRRRGLREDTAIGIVFTAMFALGVLLLVQLREDTFRDFTHIMIGSILGVEARDLRLLGGVLVVVIVVLIALHKEMELSAYDAGYASQIGIPVRGLRLVLLFLLALTIVSGIHVVGVVLTNALLITPAATASLLTRRFLPMMGVSVAVGMTSMTAGIYLAYHLDWAAGACIVLCCAALFGAGLAVRHLQSLFQRRVPGRLQA